jgi:hypothetical protein
MLWDNEVHGKSPCYDGKGRGTTTHRYLGAQIHPEDRESTEEITTSGISSYGWQGRWLVTMSSVVAKKTSGRMEQLPVILIQLPISQTRPLPQFARFTVIAKAAPGRRCSSRHSLTREELSLRGRIVFCLESLKASLPFQAPSAAMAGGLSGGTGQKLTQATIIVAGVAALLASLLSVV